MFKKDFWISFVLAFAIVFGVQALFFPSTPEEETTPLLNSAPLIVEASKSEFGLGEVVEIGIKTGSGAELIELPLDCPNEPFDVFFGAEPITYQTAATCSTENLQVNKEGLYFSYEPWNHGLFTKPGTYTVRVPYDGEQYDASFRVNGEGFIDGIWNTLFMRPIYNLLMYLTTLFNFQLGWAIIVLTLLLRLLLLIPTQRSMESQKKMKEIQPKLQEIKEKYKGNQQKIGQETMMLLKKNKVNPMGNCLPLLLQLPILLALFFAVQNGLQSAYSVHLYEPLKGLEFANIQNMFLGILDLSKPEVYIFPVLIGLLQFIQMRMAFNKTKGGEKKEKKGSKLIEQTKDNKIKIIDKSKDSPMPDMSMMNKYMQYGLPIFIAFITATLPAGVAVYWGTSTLFGIAQQYVVNKQK